MTLVGRLVRKVFAAATFRTPAGEGKDHGDEPLAGKRGSTISPPEIDRTCDFSIVDDAYATYPCTPVLGPEAEDVIWINAPEQVEFEVAKKGEPLREGEAHFVICGSMSMRAESLRALHIRDELDELVIVAVDTKTHHSYTGHIPYLGTRIPMPEALRPRGPPVFSDVIDCPFSPNLVRSFNLPAVETDYDVHVVLGPVKSNVLRVRLRRKKSESLRAEPRRHARHHAE